MINGFPLSFFLPLVVHILAGLTAGITGVVMFSLPKRRGSHQRWQGCCKVGNKISREGIKKNPSQV